MTDTDTIFTALAKAQGEFPSVPKNKSYSLGKGKPIRYADLESVISAVRPVLAKYGIAVTQNVKHEDGKVGVETVLLYGEGQSLSNGFVFAPPQGGGNGVLQQLGGALTYLRRYSLCSALCITADEDDDGMSYVPQPKQTRGPSEKEIEDAVALCKQHAMAGDYLDWWKTDKSPEAQRAKKIIVTHRPELHEEFKNFTSEG